MAEYFEPAEFHIDHEAHSKNWAMGNLHYHNCYEICFIDSGHTNFIIGDNIVSMEGGDAALHTPDTPHCNCGGGRHSRWVIYFSRAYLERFFCPEICQRLLSCFDGGIATLDGAGSARLGELMQSALSSGSDAYISVAAALTLLRNAHHVAIGEKRAQKGTMARVFDYLNENYASFESVAAAAKELYISQEYLCRLFKKHTGMTVSAYVNSKRVARACEMLISSDKSVTEIGFECGFNSTPYFCKTFKSFIDLTPYRFRASRK